MWIFLLLIVSCRATVMTYKPHIFDTYDIELFNNNPYFNRSFVNESSIMFKALSDTPVDVYNLDLVRINRIHEIDVECYSHESCEKTLSEKEIKYLSLYVSMLEACGITSIPETYSLGVLRDNTKENVVGQFTKSFRADGTLAYMTFWIRLEQENKMIYDEYDTLGLTVAMLELAVHERSHYDVTLIDLYAGHCDFYQTQYNTLVRESVKDISMYVRLTNHIMGTDNSLTVIFIIIGVVAVLTTSILIAVYCTEDKKEDKKYYKEMI